MEQNMNYYRNFQELVSEKQTQSELSVFNITLEEKKAGESEIRKVNELIKAIENLNKDTRILRAVTQRTAYDLFIIDWTDKIAKFAKKLETQWRLQNNL
jgi:hypothetical protein